MNIMFIIPRMGGGGAERVTAHIANYLSENDYDGNYAVLEPTTE